MSLERIGLTKEKLGEILSCQIKTAEIELGTSAGDNFIGLLESLKIETEDGNIFKLFLKSLPSIGNERALMTGVFWTEVAFYSGLVPALQSFAPTRSLPFPKFYYGFNDNKKDCLIMEDLKVQGFKMSNKEKGLTLEETKMALLELGKFHARTYALIRAEGENLWAQKLNGVDISRIEKDQWTEGNQPEPAQFIGFFTILYEIMTQLLAKTRPELKELLNKKIDTSPNSVSELMMKRKTFITKLFPCIVHGDFWTNNIMFKYEDNQVTQLKFIDFQNTHRGNVIEDLSYFFSTSTTIALRKDHFEVLVGKYYREFQKELKELKVPSPPNFSLGLLIDCLNEAKISAFFFLSFALPIQIGVSSADELSIENMIEWMKAAAESSPLVIQRYIEAVEELVQYDLI